MQYKALYRKYRPIDFDDVIGQDPIIQTLINSIKENKIGHAYLFTGTRGTGKTTVAKIFAKTINCENLKDGIPCGKCSVCKIKTTDENPDIIEIDAASNNGVDEIREIKNKATLVPVLCKYKVYIIDEVHMLSIGAFNALLKTLEEPPLHAVFILATTEPQKIPVTIISRCQRFDFKKIPIAEIKKRLKSIAKKEEIEIDETCLLEISKISDGSLRDAIGLLDQANSFSNGNITIDALYELTGNIETSKIFKLLENLFLNDINSLIETTDELYNSGKNFETIVESLIDILINLLIYKNAKKYFDKKEIYYKDELVELNKLVSKEKLIFVIDGMNELFENIKKSSNPNILFEIFLFKIISPSDEEKEDSEVKKEIVQKKISKETKIEKNNEKEIQKINKTYSYSIKEALINNTLAMASNHYKNDAKKALSNLSEHLATNKNKAAITVLMDCSVCAVSEDRMLLTYKYDSMVYEHDQNKSKIEKIISELLNRKYKVVAISEEKWKELRPKYVELKQKNKKIELMQEIEEETIPCKIEQQTNSNELENTINAFGIGIVEMEE